MAHLSRWLAGEGLDASALTAPVAERYFAGRRSAGYANERTAAALGPLLGYLRGLSARRRRPGSCWPGMPSYLATERALARPRWR